MKHLFFIEPGYCCREDLMQVSVGQRGLCLNCLNSRVKTQLCRSEAFLRGSVMAGIGKVVVALAGDRGKVIVNRGPAITFAQSHVKTGKCVCLQFNRPAGWLTAHEPYIVELDLVPP